MTTISTAGGNVVNIYDSDGTLYYNVNGGPGATLAWPVTLTNTDTALGFVKVLFTTNITLTGANKYFSFGSGKIQVGSESLNEFNVRPTITISISNYDGLFSNGASGVNGENDIYIYNLIIDGTGYGTQVGAGWLGHKYFGKGSTGNTIINCSSLGDINGGGILGDYAENVTLIGCSSVGDILQATGGGILGAQVTSVVLKSCWSTGDMTQDGIGGIVGANAISAVVENCYSEGDLTANNTGGIVGSNPGSGAAGVTITNCYSKGTIQGGNSGGICGSLGAINQTLTVSITNCYTTGTVVNGATNGNGGICGLLIVSGSGEVILTITNCYTSGTVSGGDSLKGYILGNSTTINGSSASPTFYAFANNFSEAGSSGGTAGTWSDTHADASLTGYPTGSSKVGTTWVQSEGINQPYELLAMGYTPYETLIISGNELVRVTSQTIQQGYSSTAALNADASGNAFSILEKTAGNSDSYDTITISAQTGVISTTEETAVGTYTLTLRSTGSYNITQFILTVTVSVPDGTAACCVTTIGERGLAYEQINDYRIGNTLLAEHSANTAMKFNDYAEYVRFKMAQGSAKY